MKPKKQTISFDDEEENEEPKEKEEWASIDDEDGFEPDELPAKQRYKQAFKQAFKTNDDPKLSSFREKEVELELLKAQIELEKLKQSKQDVEEEEEVIKETKKIIPIQKKKVHKEEEIVQENDMVIVQKKTWFSRIFPILITFLVFFFFLSMSYFLFSYFIPQINLIWLWIISIIIAFIPSFLVRWFLYLREEPKLPMIQNKIQTTKPDEIHMKENEDFINLKRCPKCSSRLYKGKVIVQNNQASQTFKCKNKYCDYFKTINLSP